MRRWHPLWTLLLSLCWCSCSDTLNTGTSGAQADQEDLADAHSDVNFPADLVGDLVTDPPTDVVEEPDLAMPDQGADRNQGDPDQSEAGEDQREDPEVDQDLAPDSDDVDEHDEESDADTSGEVDTIEFCDGILCGDVCCSAPNECVQDQCLPPCASGVRCGPDQSICCGDEQVCLSGACEDIGGACLDSYDCDSGYFCEPTLARCLPQGDEVSCEVIPVFESFEILKEWSWEVEQVISIPIVADIEGDATPEVVVNATRMGEGGGWPDGQIVILNGATGAEIRRFDSPLSHGRSTIAVGDVDGDFAPDVIYASAPVSASGSTIHAVAADGTPIWTARSDGEDVVVVVENAAVTLANFDDDPQTEVVLGAMLIDHDGTVIWNQDGEGPSFGTNALYTGGISAVADINDDGRPEIVSGAHAWLVNWGGPNEEGNDPVEPLWLEPYDGPDGYPAVADLDGDSTPEVVIVGSRELRIVNGADGTLWCAQDECAEAADRVQPLLLPGEETKNRGGPPTISDFDDDGRPEIGIAGGYAYTVYDIYRPDETVVYEQEEAPEPGQIYVRWTDETRDLSSNATGSSVFDFEGDGSAEVIYADECFMRAYSGTDGSNKLTIPSSSATIHEYPLVVDVDGDNNSEIVIVANSTSSATNCGHVEDYEGRQGVFVYGDPQDRWVRTRRVWNQHTYHVTNATSDGNVPASEVNNWEAEGLNNYRQNVQGEGVFNAPDLALRVNVDTSECSEGAMNLSITVSNIGDLGVGPGVSIVIYNGTDDSGDVVATVSTDSALLPGASLILTHRLAVVIDDEYDFYLEIDEGEVAIIECEDENNAVGLEEVGCFEKS